MSRFGRLVIGLGLLAACIEAEPQPRRLIRSQVHSSPSSSVEINAFGSFVETSAKASSGESPSHIERNRRKDINDSINATDATIDDNNATNATISSNNTNYSSNGSSDTHSFNSTDFGADPSWDDHDVEDAGEVDVEAPTEATNTAAPPADPPEPPSWDIVTSDSDGKGNAFNPTVKPLANGTADELSSTADAVTSTADAVNSTVNSTTDAVNSTTDAAVNSTVNSAADAVNSTATASTLETQAAEETMTQFAEDGEAKAAADALANNAIHAFHEEWESNAPQRASSLVERKQDPNATNDSSTSPATNDSSTSPAPNDSPTSPRLVSSANQVGTNTFEICANKSGNCSCADGIVLYGQGSDWISLRVTGTILCEESSFVNHSSNHLTASTNGGPAIATTLFGSAKTSVGSATTSVGSASTNASSSSTNDTGSTTNSNTSGNNTSTSNGSSFEVSGTDLSVGGASLMESADPADGIVCRCYSINWCKAQPNAVTKRHDRMHRRRTTSGSVGTGFHQRRRWCGWGARDCIWDEWSEWTQCSMACGGGTRSRHRAMKQSFENGGKCPGASEETEDCSSHACSHNFVYWKFQPLESRGGSSTNAQIADIVFQHNNLPIDMLSATASLAGPGDPSPENPPENAIDEKPATVWRDTMGDALVLKFPTGVVVDEFRFQTASDSMDDDPERWTLSGSQDGEVWIVVQSQDANEHYTVPEDRQKFTRWYPLMSTAIPDDEIVLGGLGGSSPGNSSSNTNPTIATNDTTGNTTANATDTIDPTANATNTTDPNVTHAGDAALIERAGLDPKGATAATATKATNAEPPDDIDPSPSADASNPTDAVSDGDGATGVGEDDGDGATATTV